MKNKPEIARVGSTHGSAWRNKTKFWKRVNGFFVYQFWSLVAIYDPEMADRVMLVVLKEQFSEPNK